MLCENQNNIHGWRRGESASGSKPQLARTSSKPDEKSKRLPSVKNTPQEHSQILPPDLSSYLVILGITSLHPAKRQKVWTTRGSNPRPSACKADALPLRQTPNLVMFYITKQYIPTLLSEEINTTILSSAYHSPLSRY
jgi:hypothetical protein